MVFMSSLEKSAIKNDSSSHKYASGLFLQTFALGQSQCLSQRDAEMDFLVFFYFPAEGELRKTRDSEHSAILISDCVPFDAFAVRQINL